jgi:predicted house-cleaning NTP pyrophosphatase (Maf/HAM1 superfamily)
VVVSGDAVVSKEGRIYEKPRNLEEASQFLRELSGGEFQFVTALAVMHSSTRRMLSTVEVSDIWFRHLADHENPGVHRRVFRTELCRCL